MAIKNKDLSKPRWLAAFLVLAVVITVCVGRYYCLDRNAWAAWVQAVGSVLAVLVAVWVSWHQSEQERSRQTAAERAEVAGVLRSLQAEVETTLSYAGSQIAESLDGTQAGVPITSIFPIPEYPFPIFDALIPKLGLIRDAHLQRQVVDTFSTAKGLAMTIHHHNEFVEALRAAEFNHSEAQSGVSGARLNVAARQLAQYSVSLREAFSEGRGKLLALRSALERACVDN
jgi:ABC-type nickel/cobalt efflux system permease component RcnA